HDQVADETRGDFFLTAVTQAITNAFDRGIHAVGADWPLAQGELETGMQLGKIELDTRAIALDHGGHEQLRPLVGGETAFAGRTAAPATDDVALILHPCVDHLSVGAIAVGALHGRAAAM